MNEVAVCALIVLAVFAVLNADLAMVVIMALVFTALGAL